MYRLRKDPFRSGFSLPNSKSEAQRYLILAAMAEGETEISLFSELLSDDISACVDCVRELGAEVVQNGRSLTVRPGPWPPDRSGTYVFRCGESATLHRFLMAVARACGLDAEFIAGPGLSVRPSGKLGQALDSLGTGRVPIDGMISSQYVSALLLAMSQRGGSVEVLGSPVSRPYVDMTVRALAEFGCRVEVSPGEKTYTVPRTRLMSPGRVSVGADWSAAAFALAAGTLGSVPVTVSGPDRASSQGDKEILDLLRSFRAGLDITPQGYTTVPSELVSPGLIDCRDFPDLVPVLAAVALTAKGETVLFGIGHLQYKESDRTDSVCSCITSLGARAYKNEYADDMALFIPGSQIPSGGSVRTCGDHRIALMAALLSSVCTGAVFADDVSCISKSWPGFSDSLILGGRETVN